MAPRGHTLPQATTESAREARKAFFCDLCQKGYARTTEYESHLDSYDHLHRQRMKDMRAMTRDPNAASRPRKEESSELSGRISIPLKSSIRDSSLPGGGSKFTPVDGSGGNSSLAGAGSVKKKPVFKALAFTEVVPASGGVGAAVPPTTPSGQGDVMMADGVDAVGVNYDDPSAAKANGWEAEAYTPGWASDEARAPLRDVVLTASGELAFV